MTKPKQDLYFHQPTGQIMWATKKEAKKLDGDWHKMEFTQNEKGQDVMRFKFVDSRGVTATVDVRETTPEEGNSDGNGNAE